MLGEEAGGGFPYGGTVARRPRGSGSASGLSAAISLSTEGLRGGRARPCSMSRMLRVPTRAGSASRAWLSPSCLGGLRTRPPTAQA
ncbi:hypothetical protein GCM10023084_04850 [Streptomyces lacrimifluminis]|uniref:Uncharacterized protein n=1 Tax=Streptomyces lacrimifluminis TaxID=1500077 RepID=A0A917KSG1_9ACTN|nr:hypothetical protein GCM10012282_18590 [Streptomyces lacrimifluminis]